MFCVSDFPPFPPPAGIVASFELLWICQVDQVADQREVLEDCDRVRRGRKPQNACVGMHVASNRAAALLGVLVCSAVIASVRSWVVLRQRRPDHAGNGQGAKRSALPAPKTLLGSQVTLLVASSLTEINTHVRTLMCGRPTCIGLDAEWRPAKRSKSKQLASEDSDSASSDVLPGKVTGYGSRQNERNENPVAVLQLASEDVVVVIQLLHATEGGRVAVPMSLQELLAAPHIVKFGVGMRVESMYTQNNFKYAKETRACLRTHDIAKLLCLHVKPPGIHDDVRRLRESFGLECRYT